MALERLKSGNTNTANSTNANINSANQNRANQQSNDFTSIIGGGAKALSMFGGDDGGGLVGDNFNLGGNASNMSAYDPTKKR